jgi:4-oxalocrotonate tautomerase
MPRRCRPGELQGRTLPPRFSFMPYVNVQILRGATRRQKQQLFSDITASLVQRLGKSPEHIHIVIDEVSTDNWGYAGMLTTDFLRRKNNAGRRKTVRKK